ncbi:MAG: hypothetical protein MZV49_05550 [Rhodopseudomonas palustris]|nr:hypothetical protein [Rhodopseudomonas palustris]
MQIPRPFIPATAHLPELTLRALLMGVVLGVIFGASSLVPGPQGRPDGQRIDPGRGHRRHPVSTGPQDRRTGRDHPRKQHRADRRFGRRIHRLRSWASPCRPS